MDHPPLTGPASDRTRDEKGLQMATQPPADTATSAATKLKLDPPEVLQPVARELVWAGMRKTPAAMVSYSEHSRLRLPAPVVRANAPLIRPTDL